MTESAPKKGTSPFVWIFVGCGALALIAVGAVAIGSIYIARKGGEFVEQMEKNPEKTMAEMMIRANPDVELVDSDDADGSITIKDKKSGEVMKVTFTKGADGTLKLEGPDGELVLGGGAAAEAKIPKWVPRYPDAEEEAAAFAFSATQKGGDTATTGAVTFRTDDQVDTVIEHYAELLEDDGYDVTKVTANATKGGQGGLVTGVDQKRGRTLTCTIGEDGDKTAIVVHYVEGKTQ